MPWHWPFTKQQPAPRQVTSVQSPFQQLSRDVSAYPGTAYSTHLQAMLALCAPIEQHYTSFAPQFAPPRRDEIIAQAQQLVPVTQAMLTEMRAATPDAMFAQHHADLLDGLGRMVDGLTQLQHGLVGSEEDMAMTYGLSVTALFAGRETVEETTRYIVELISLTRQMRS